MAHEWKDKVVLITGAATGIGAAVVRNLMEEDIKHVVILDIAEAAGIALQNELNAKYGENKVKFFKCDVTNEEQLLGYFDELAKDQGTIDVVINNAGIMNDSMKSYKKQIDINVTALVTGTIKGMKIMGKNYGGNGGTVINISSIAGLTQSPMLPIYFATKSAVLQFSNCIGMDDYYKRTQVRVLTVCFGATDTPLLHTQNLGNFDEDIESGLEATVEKFPFQTIESAAKGLVDMYKKGESGSTWIVTTNRPAKDITATVQKAYALLTEHVFE